MNKRISKRISILLAVCMLITLLLHPAFGQVQAAESTNKDYLERYVYGAKIVNHKDMPSWTTNYDSKELNFFSVFSRVAYPCGAPSMAGISLSLGDDDYDCENRQFTDTDIDHVRGFFRGTIDIAQIPELKRIAEGGTAKFIVKVGKLNSSSNNGAYIKVFTNGAERWYEHSTKDEEDKYNIDSGWIGFGSQDKIMIQTETNGTGTTVENIRIYFADVELPAVANYTFTSDGTERVNKELGQQELFLKKDQSLHLTYNFSKPVQANAPVALAGLSSHKLFMNPAGTALPANGQPQGLKLGLTADEAKQYVKALPYDYTASDYHHTGNSPIEGGGGLQEKKMEEKSLWTKIDEAEFHDGAGNPLQILDGFTAAGSSSNSFLAGKKVNPFDYEHSGYRVVIDAVPPRYSSSTNGIQPDILTGSTLNKGDVVDFIVNLTEKAIVKEGENWNAKGLYLKFNNGMKAYYVEGENSETWRFRATVTEATSDVSLLKVIALTHDSKPDHTDTGVIQDYAGNLLMDRVNTGKVENSDDALKSVPETRIDWAKLSIDNTKPVLGFRYEDGGANGETYGKKGKITIDANDPDIITPKDDPTESGIVRPGSGIYRPLNMTGSGSDNAAGVGLVYYYWSKKAENPLAAKEADQFAAVKRYSLTGQQPREGLYPGEMPDFNLMGVNNKTNLLLPPAEAFAPENSGTWYLHTWTADMTWDTARQLMQYKKTKQFKADHAKQYEDWKSEYKNNHPGSSDQDAEGYADGEALKAVGKYGDLSLWPAADFKHDDSNWVYAAAPILLDNQPPDIKPGVPSGNNTAEVKVPVELEDKHSGLDTEQLLFQWVKPGEEPSEIGWAKIPDSRIVTTLNHVVEDGEYELYLKAADKAGNQTSVKIAERAIVNSKENIRVAFAPEASERYVKSHPITFSISGLSVGEAVYAFSPSAARPEDKAYYPLTLALNGLVPPVGGHSVGSAVYGAGVTSSVYGLSVTGAVYDNAYLIPKDETLNGLQYLHIKLRKQGEDRYYYYYTPYRFDNAAPAVSFSLPGVGYPKASHSVTVTATELYNAAGMITQYQWVKSTDKPPAETSGNWMLLPEDGVVTIDNSKLAKGEVADYVLYVYAIDGAGNGAIRHTDAFRLVREDSAPIEVLQSDLVYIGGNESDGYYAIAKLMLGNASKDGFEYSISSDGGATWKPWMPYSNFVKAEVSGGQADQLKLKVKFKSPSGIVSRETTIDTRGYTSVEDPVYGLAVHSTLRPVAGGVSLKITVPAGIKVVPSASLNPAPPVRVSGNTFEIPQNGLYTFELSDVVDSKRKDQLLVVVKNIDNTPPVGVIEQKITGPTTSNVQVKLHTSKDVRILNNDGRDTYTFTDNGTFTFQFEDEAGHTGSATATVTNIDRTQPGARIVKSYAYGEQGGQTFKTIQDASGQVMLAQGVTLSVEKADAGGKDFIVVRGNDPKDPNGRVTQLQNGTASFTVADLLGNTNVLEENITNLVGELPAPESIAYEFTDDNGNPLPEEKIVTIQGKKYAKGKVKVTLKGKVNAPNQVFIGTVPIEQDSGYANRISDANGNYSYSALYSTNGELRIALSDLLGNVTRTVIRVEGLDNTPPTITLKNPVVAVTQNKKDFNPLVDLGGYTVSDNVSDPSKLKVAVQNLDLSKLGRQTVTYTVTDEVGNSSSVTQEVMVLSSGGLLITGNGQMLSSALAESVLFDRSHITFTVSGYNEMNVEGKSMINEQGRYDILYHSGLYREGQMKYIAQQVTMEQLLSNRYEVAFPETGWYTIVVRTQEREREFASFFIGKMD
ncbi:DUF5011/hyalin repeat domain-containing protein [Paenibacillus tyrfis]|uniref:Ig-like domain-containing protein n=1 Tax=Paenibacillus tyrfis TaxID=1501230 RepID=A0A081NUL4_9BACL|nr:hypothetical protein [Paenibacillus tyrfis]KEQ22137.1 hypothetical protein ET33_27665 [Paenibacillus tyrfis]